MSMDPSKIHINPAFLNKPGFKKPSIHINPAFVNNGNTTQVHYPGVKATTTTSYYSMPNKNSSSVTASNHAQNLCLPNNFSSQNFHRTQFIPVSNASRYPAKIATTPRNYRTHIDFHSSMDPSSNCMDSILSHEFVHALESNVPHLSNHANQYQSSKAKWNYAETLKNQTALEDSSNFSYPHNALEKNNSTHAKAKSSLEDPIPENFLDSHKIRKSYVRGNLTVYKDTSKTKQSNVANKNLIDITRGPSLGKNKRHCVTLPQPSVKSTSPNPMDEFTPKEKIGNDKSGPDSSNSTKGVNDFFESYQPKMYTCITKQPSSQENHLSYSQVVNKDSLPHVNSDKASDFSLRNMTKNPASEYSMVSSTKLIRNKNNSRLSPKNKDKYKFLSRAKLVRRRSKNSSFESNKPMKLSNISKKSLTKVSSKLSNSKFTSQISSSTPSSSSKFEVISKNKLIRRKSCSKSNSTNNASPKPLDAVRKLERYKTLSKTKLVKMNPKSSCPDYGYSSKYNILSRNKLIRRRSKNASNASTSKKIHLKTKVSCSPNVKPLNNSPHTKMPVLTSTKKHGNMKFLSRYKLSRQSLFSDKITPERSHHAFDRYKVLTKNKIIRRRSNSFSSELKLNPKMSKARMKLIQSVSNPSLSYVVVRESTGDVKFAFKTHTKLVNKKLADISAQDFINSSSFNYTKKLASVSSYNGKFASHPKKMYLTRSTTSSNNRKKRWAGKSDKFVNIDGSLYKMTSTSLKKHDLKGVSQKKRLLSEKNRFLKPGTLIEMARRKKLADLRKTNQQCRFFMKTGKCQRQELGACPFLHDKEKVAICTRFLMGKCTSSKCSFLHKYDRSRMPVCSHFLKGGCTREGCLYRHVRVNPNAPLCLNFIRGYCHLEEECKKKHILICEEFSQTGVCKEGKHCPLSHPKKRITATKSPANHKLKARKRSFSNTDSPKQVRRPRRSLRNPSHKGVLGLSVKSDKNGSFSKKTVSKSRYFEAYEPSNSTKEPEVEAGTPVHPPNTDTVERDPHSLTPIQHPSFPHLKDKRERMLKKVEKLKENYTVGFKPQSGDSGTSPSVPPELHFVDDLKKMDSSHSGDSEKVEDDNCSLKYGFVPLPDSLPDFIPLVLPDNE